jgi:transcription initiation factor TFIIIB Brf1 subunit/transcription initiation factor TFIIB
MLKVWVGLEARSFLQASIDTVWNMTLVLHGNTDNPLGRAMRQIRPAFTEYIMKVRSSFYSIRYSILLILPTTVKKTAIRFLERRSATGIVSSKTEAPARRRFDRFEASITSVLNLVC